MYYGGACSCPFSFDTRTQQNRLRGNQEPRTVSAPLKLMGRRAATQRPNQDHDTNQPKPYQGEEVGVREEKQMGHLEQATRAQMATEGNITRGIRGVPVPTVRSTMRSTQTQQVVLMGKRNANARAHCDEHASLLMQQLLQYKTWT